MFLKSITFKTLNNKQTHYHHQHYNLDKTNKRNFSKTNSFVGGIGNFQASTIKQSKDTLNYVSDEIIKKQTDFAFKTKKIIDEQANKNGITNYQFECSGELGVIKWTIHFTKP